MRVVVFGAGGGTGRQIVEQALGHGHDVTAFIRSTPVGLDSPRLTEVAGDALDFESVSAVVAGQDAVASGLGFSRSQPGDVVSKGTANIIHAMAVHEVRKLAVVSVAGAFKRDERILPLQTRLLIKTVLRSAYDDLERMEERVLASDLVWTIVRPVGLTDGRPTGTYRFTADGSLLPKTSLIARADVAAAVLKALETDLWDRRIVTVAQ